MAEYRALRARYSLLDICRTPDLATEVTLQPIRRIEVDAAILFSDLLIPLEPLGLPFDFVKGEGPQLERPIRSAADIDALRTFDPREALGHVLETIRLVQRELAGRVPLIGFAGAPFTLASYAIEGGHSNNFAYTKALMYGHPDAWHRLCDRLASTVADYLVAQIEAGGVDWRSPIDTAWEQIGFDRAVQGNLDPTLLLGPSQRMMRQTDDILARVGGRPGHVFNLGHGILPSTPLEHVQTLAQYVHSTSRHHQAPR
jgi:uroporphyrinogen decarboxylase